MILSAYAIAILLEKVFRGRKAPKSFSYMLLDIGRMARLRLRSNWLSMMAVAAITTPEWVIWSWRWIASIRFFTSLSRSVIAHLQEVLADCLLRPHLPVQRSRSGDRVH